ncbi:Protein-S-isoprenylcysteine O-methyltransferase Ste14 [Aequorivita viscosa]|uniref:Protein-S-isoprenylcysteine O-methyltransferase Ste14 n=1 Tax=Aequorivita viscosa TaxID=797419 RepID=A0A1M6J2P8_9FLAO|nr:Protein-S-isoprenylcysteine O-methyltransferase Ste14 [Aequorivita viscosa]SHJ40927.1 Protein-S-isoprenylcysteine O-methyltransferase Ste14 [Aequorivita viscosa]
MVLQFLLFIAFSFEIDSMAIIFPEVLFWFGVVIFVIGAFITITAALQLNFNLSPFPSPLPGSNLIENGVYKFIRHPIYTGLILSFFGFAIISDSGYRILITAVLFLLFYFKTIYEEKRLIEKFPRYLEYKSRSGRFFPWS